MPFLADILLKIYRTIGKNWERAGNVRYAVVCRPGGDGMERGSASERAGAIAAEWSEAMRDSQSGVVRAFVAVGDVSVKVIGADGPVLDAAVPVRQLREQLVSRRTEHDSIPGKGADLREELLLFLRLQGA